MDKNELKSKAAGYFGKTVEQAKRLGSEITEFASENKELVIACIPLAIAGLRMGKTHAVTARQKRERERISRTYYDPQTGFHWDLKRKASNHDRREISRLKATGMSTYDILEKLRLI